jgi:hypothetical protein
MNPCSSSVHSAHTPPPIRGGRECAAQFVQVCASSSGSLSSSLCRTDACTRPRNERPSQPGKIRARSASAVSPLDPPYRLRRAISVMSRARENKADQRPVSSHTDGSTEIPPARPRSFTPKPEPRAASECLYPNSAASFAHPLPCRDRPRTLRRGAARSDRLPERVGRGLGAMLVSAESQRRSHDDRHPVPIGRRPVGQRRIDHARRWRWIGLLSTVVRELLGLRRERRKRWLNGRGCRRYLSLNDRWRSSGSREFLAPQLDLKRIVIAAANHQQVSRHGVGLAYRRIGLDLSGGCGVDLRRSHAVAAGGCATFAAAASLLHEFEQLHNGSIQTRIELQCFDRTLLEYRVDGSLMSSEGGVYLLVDALLDFRDGDMPAQRPLGPAAGFRASGLEEVGFRCFVFVCHARLASLLRRSRISLAPSDVGRQLHCLMHGVPRGGAGMRGGRSIFFQEV